MMRFPLELPAQPRQHKYSKPARMILWFLAAVGAVAYWIVFILEGAR